MSVFLQVFFCLANFALVVFDVFENVNIEYRIEFLALIEFGQCLSDDTAVLRQFAFGNFLFDFFNHIQIGFETNPTFLTSATERFGRCADSRADF